MRAGDMNLSFLQPGEGKFAGRGGRHDFDTADSLHHIRDEAYSRVTPSEQKTLLRSFLFSEDHQVGPAVCAACTLDDAIRLWHEERSVGNGDTDPTSADLADSNRLTLIWRRAAKNFSSYRFR